jgi:hypothetical protein
MLSTSVQANALLEMLSALPGFPQQAIAFAWGTVNNAAGGTAIALNGDERGFYEIELPGGISYNVGQLVAQMNAQGVGAPGNWTYSAIVGPVWVSTVAGPTLPSAPVIPPGAPPPPNAVLAGGIIPLSAGAVTFDTLAAQLDTLQATLNNVAQRLGVPLPPS